jgi:hypothetical protein
MGKSPFSVFSGLCISGNVQAMPGKQKSWFPKPGVRGSIPFRDANHFQRVEMIFG